MARIRDNEPELEEEILGPIITKRFLQLTKELGLNNKPSKLAKLMGVSESAIGKYRNGGGIGLIPALRLCRAAKVNPEWLAGLSRVRERLGDAPTSGETESLGTSLGELHAAVQGVNSHLQRLDQRLQKLENATEARPRRGRGASG